MDQAKPYWLSKDRITAEAYGQDDWDAIEIAMKESQRARRVFLSKHISGMCGVGKFMVQWKKREVPDC